MIAAGNRGISEGPCWYQTNPSVQCNAPSNADADADADVVVKSLR